MNKNIPRWMQELGEEDWQFIKRLILASGSLKDVAGQYAISYPTVRIRLDRLIEKIKILDTDCALSPFHQAIQLLLVEGKLDMQVARTIISAHDDSVK